MTQTEILARLHRLQVGTEMGFNEATGIAQLIRDIEADMPVPAGTREEVTFTDRWGRTHPVP